MTEEKTTTASVIFDVAWKELEAQNQTLFPLDEEGEILTSVKDLKTSEKLMLRVTKQINMKPSLRISLLLNGQPFQEDQEVKLTLVDESTKMPPEKGNCNNCNGPTILESKPLQLRKKGGEFYAKICGGVIEFLNLQISCCTGSSRGHGCLFAVKAEIVTEGPFHGLIAFTPAIQVRSKNPFEKCNRKRKASEICEDSPNYKGCKELIEIMKKMELTKFISIFTRHEIDPNSFVRLKDRHLQSMGISKQPVRDHIIRQIQEFIKQKNQQKERSSSESPEENSNKDPLNTITPAPYDLIREDDIILDDQALLMLDFGIPFDLPNDFLNASSLFVTPLACTFEHPVDFASDFLFK